jgi:hypothetical protein
MFGVDGGGRRSRSCSIKPEQWKGTGTSMLWTRYEDSGSIAGIDERGDLPPLQLQRLSRLWMDI